MTTQKRTVHDENSPKPPLSATSEVAAAVVPPWQLKWKRPRLDHVIYGIDKGENQTNEHCDKSINDERYRDHFEELHPDWIPISSSSVVLTRNEAQRAIAELDSKDLLLLSRDKLSTKTKQKIDDQTLKCDDKSSLHTSIRQSSIDNTKNQHNNTAKTSFFLHSWFKKSEGRISSSNIVTAKTSILSENNNVQKSIPPRFQGDRSELFPQAPSSPTHFSTFSDVDTSPQTTQKKSLPIPHNTSSKDEYISSPRILMDASVASSLLWEDMTLTSVSDEEAAAFRRHGSNRMKDDFSAAAVNASPSKNDINDGNHVVLSMGDEDKMQQFKDYRSEEYHNCSEEKDSYDSDRNMQVSEWDGFDNVVLTVTIFATACKLKEATRPLKSPTNWNSRPTSGLVIVMELLSTKDPPFFPISCGESGGLSKSSKQKLNKDAVSTKPQKAASMVEPVSGEMEESICNSFSCINKQKSPNQYQCFVDEEETPSNYTRILARRILHWPTSILTNDSKHQSIFRGKLYPIIDGCPSFVSLGRTIICEERDSHCKKYHQESEPIGSRKQEINTEETNYAVVKDDYSILHQDPDINERRSVCSSSYALDRGERAEEALDVLRSLNFLFKVDNSDSSTPADGGSVNFSRSKNKDASNTTLNGDNGLKKMKISQPLFVSFVTNDGRVLFFHAMSLLSRKHYNRNSKTGISNSFASFLFEPNLFSKLCEDVAPLSRPIASLKLSQILNSSQQKGKDLVDTNDFIDDDTDRDPCIWRSIVMNNAEDEHNHLVTTEDDISDYAVSNGWSRLGVFDATIDPTYINYRTILQSNVVTSTCITSDSNNAYLAVCGKGLRRVAQSNGQNIIHVLGGFLTLVSLRHCTEAKTIYLPFAPDSIHPVYSCGAHYVILLGVKGPVSTPKLNDARFDGGKLFVTRNRSKSRNPYAIAVRVDSRNIKVFSSLDRKCSSHSKSMTTSRVSTSSLHRGSFDNLYSSTPIRFQPILINFPPVHESLGHFSHLFSQDKKNMQISIKATAIDVSSIPSSPPGIIIEFQCSSMLNDAFPNVILVNHTLSSFLSNSVSTSIRPGHRLLLNTPKKHELRDISIRSENCKVLSNPNHEDELNHLELRSIKENKESPFLKVWCTGGQGWSLIGIRGYTFKYFISWDGATDAGGAYLLQLLDDDYSVGQKTEDMFESHGILSKIMPLISYTVSSMKGVSNTSFVTGTRKKGFESRISPYLRTGQEGSFPDDYLPNLSCSSTLRESMKSTAEIEGGIDDIVVNALSSITKSHNSSERVTRLSRSNVLGMSHAQKSKRILQHCSSWTQLDDTRANHEIVHGQVIAAIIRFGPRLYSLTMRTNVMANPLSTPFNLVLSWLCQRNDYYTAASVALSLLNDVDALYELRGISNLNEGDHISHQGLLDNITPLVKYDHTVIDVSNHQTLTSLADMTVGCLIKGGVSMSSTLEGFLTRNTLYDAPRASLMLVGTVAFVMSAESLSDVNHTNDDNIMKMISNAEAPGDHVLWPIRCLIKMAVARRCLSSSLLMLNVTIPDELRWRSPTTRGLSPSIRPSLGLFLTIIEIILESTGEATRFLLNLIDEKSGLYYWSSIDNDTRFALSLLSIHGKYVMIRQPEVRSWAVERLREEIECPECKTSSRGNLSLPEEWLIGVITGVFGNAECDITFGVDVSFLKASKDESSSYKDEDGQCYRQEMVSIQNLLIPRKGSGGLDFDLLIPSLLILVSRGCQWRERSMISTQVLLNVVCESACRGSDVDPRFLIDVRAILRQCALSGNLQATAFLVGGRSGLVLECADLLISKFGLTMKEAEIALVGSLVEVKEMKARSCNTPYLDIGSVFYPNEGHHHVLWLLQNYVLNVQKYGDFYSPSNMAIVTPVIAGGVCFRAWYFLTDPSVHCDAAKWLEHWIRRKLRLINGESPKRLACAALVRSLLWPDESNSLDFSDGDEELILGGVVGFDYRFMAEIAHASLGLVESVPPSFSDEIISGLGGSSNILSFDVKSESTLNVFSS